MGGISNSTIDQEKLIWQGKNHTFESTYDLSEGVDISEKTVNASQSALLGDVALFGAHWTNVIKPKLKNEEASLENVKWTVI